MYIVYISKTKRYERLQKKNMVYVCFDIEKYFRNFVNFGLLSTICNKCVQQQQ